MKFPLTILYLVLCSAVVGQNRSLLVSHYSFAAKHWISSSYQVELSKSWKVATGLGYNLSANLISVADPVLSPHARGKNVFQNFNINLGVQYSLPLNRDNVDIYLFDKMDMAYSPVYYPAPYYVNGNLYYHPAYSPAVFLLDNTTGLGLDVTIFSQWHFFTRAGLTLSVDKYNAYADIYGKSRFASMIWKEFGVRYVFTKKRDSKI